MGGPLHHAGAFGKRRVLPVLKCCVGLGNGLTHSGWGHLVVRLDSFACGRVNSLECHTMSSCVVVVILYYKKSTLCTCAVEAPRHRAAHHQGGGS
jgi:hypothetical protein